MGYLRAVVSKAHNVQKLASKGSSLLSSTLDLSQLLHPNMFLTALRQETAREYGGKVPLDGLRLVNAWGGGGDMKGAKLPVAVGGLFVEGCRFDGASLRDNAPDSPTISPLPIVTIAWVPQVSGKIISFLYLSNRTLYRAVFEKSPLKWQKVGSKLVSRAFLGLSRLSRQLPAVRGHYIMYLYYVFVFVHYIMYS
jgi:hypothetical protein